MGDSEGVVGASVISSPVSDGKTDGSGGPKHSAEEPSEGPTSGNLLHSRNVGHPTSVFSSMTFSDQNILPCGTVGDSLANKQRWCIRGILYCPQYAQYVLRMRKRWHATIQQRTMQNEKSRSVASHDCRLASSQSSLPLVKTPITLH